jgi:hypothetical protein
MLAGNLQRNRGLPDSGDPLASLFRALCGTRYNHYGHKYTAMWDLSTAFSIFLLPLLPIRFWCADSEWQND